MHFSLVRKATDEESLANAAEEDDFTPPGPWRNGDFHHHSTQGKEDLHGLCFRGFSPSW